MDITRMRRITAFLPVLMSLAALALVIGHVAFVGTARQADEGMEAHLWQLLMAGQLPIVMFSALASFPQARRQTLGVLGLQFAAAAAAMAPVYLLRF